MEVFVFLRFRLFCLFFLSWLGLLKRLLLISLLIGLFFLDLEYLIIILDAVCSFGGLGLISQHFDIFLVVGF